MAFKFVVFVACLAVARAGLIDYGHGYAAGPAATSHSSIVSHAGPVSYGAPIAKYAAAPVVSYAQAAPAYSYGHAGPAYSYGHAAPALSYAAPVAKVAYSAPVAHYSAPIAKTVVAEPYAPAHYDFEYAVNDPHTGDAKTQKESRQGDVVHGSYSLIEADGSKRIVEYTADDHNGFNAVVHREPAQHPVAVKAVKTIAAPVAHYAAAPVAHYAASPVVKSLGYAHAGPAISYGHAGPGISYGHAGPAIAYGHGASSIAYGHAAPALAYGAPAHGYYH